MFFFWNGVCAVIISPLLTWLFSLMTPIYEFLFTLSKAIFLPFDYNFIESTFIFIFTTCVTMVLNYLFYDRLVFGDQIRPRQKPFSSALENNPKVSVIVPIYNTAAYLPSCLNSIIRQSYQNLEIILIDDGSTDNSALIVDQYVRKDPRITAFHQKNSGQSSARNFGLQIASGEYTCFIDADDELKPSFIKDLLAAISENTPLAVCGIHYKRLKHHSAEDVYITPLRPRRPKETKKSYLLYLLATDGRMYSSVNKLYHTALAKKCHFDPKLNFAEDTKFVLDYLTKSYLNHDNVTDPAFVLKPLYIYNFGTTTSTMRVVSVNWQNWQTSYRNLKSWLGRPTIKEWFWLHTVHLRWRISYLRSKRRAR